MLSRVGFAVKYWLLWIFFFELARVIFLLKNFNQARGAGFRLSAESLWHGLRMDASMAAYFTLPVILFLIVGLFSRPFLHPLLYKIYSGLLLLASLLLVLIDINLYQAWGSRVDASFLKYLSNPQEVYASISHLPLLAIGFIFIAGYLFFLVFFNKRIAKWLKQLQSPRSIALEVAALVLMMGVLIIPLRGGLQLAPLNQSAVYFSRNNFINLAALNAPWNFMHSLSHKVDTDNNPFMYMDSAKARQLVDSLYAVKSSTVQPALPFNPNVLLVVLESFTSKAIGQTWEGKEITPGFNRLMREGMYFSDIYATGDRTDKGIVGILSGYPAQPTTSIIKDPAKAARLPVLPRLFKEWGYETGFYYGGELEFANMKAYLMGGNYDRYVSIDDFSEKDRNSKWGAHDGVVMERLIHDLDKARSPFFYTWLTLTSHEPFEIPVAPVFKGRKDVDQFLNSVHYTDSIITRFVESCRRKPWWKNSFLVFVADHGHKLPLSNSRIADHKIPILILGGDSLVRVREFAATGSQTDLPATLLGLLGKPATSFQWSRNLLDSNRLPWAFFSFNNGFGFIQPAGKLVFDNVGKQVIEQQGKVDSADIRKGRALQQLSFQDYLLK